VYDFAEACKEIEKSVDQNHLRTHQALMRQNLVLKAWMESN